MTSLNRVEYEQTQDDILNFQRYHKRRAQARRSPRGLTRAAIWWCVAILALAALMLQALIPFSSGSVGSSSDYAWFGRWLLPWLPVAGFVVLLLWSARRQRLAMIKAILTGADGTHREMELTPQALLVKTQAVEERMAWSAILAIEEAPDAIYLYRMDCGYLGMAYLVPKRIFPNGREIAAFLETARAFQAGRQPMLPPLPMAAPVSAPVSPPADQA